MNTDSQASTAAAPGRPKQGTAPSGGSAAHAVVSVGATSTCIEFVDVVAGYKDFMILNNLSFKAKRGTITLLLGPNGAG